MKKFGLSIFVLYSVLAFAGIASADSISFSFSGPGLNAAGTFYAQPGTAGQWLVTGAAGTFNGSAITGIEPLTSNGKVFSFNNIYYWPNPVVDLYGIVFDVAGGDKVNLCYDSGCAGAAGMYTAIVFDPNAGLTNLNATVQSFSQPIPEPGTLVLIGTGLLGLAGALGRKLNF